jgi:cobalamin-dependent methionine synthase I
MFWVVKSARVMKKAVAIYAFIEAAKLVTNQGMEKSLWQP